MNKKLDAILTVVLLGLYFVAALFIFALARELLTRDDPHCVRYSPTTGECVKEMTVGELIDNAQE